VTNGILVILLASSDVERVGTVGGLLAARLYVRRRVSFVSEAVPSSWILNESLACQLRDER